MQDFSAQWVKIEQELKRVWGYDRFRSPQQEVIQSLLRQEDSLIVLPTGTGKSLCFQLPALMGVGTTLVISPLIALMENQLGALKEKKIPAACLHSNLPRSLRTKILGSLARQQLKLLYLAPETLLSPPVWQQLSQPSLKLNGLIIDEAHCLAQWGQTFRPAYSRLGIARRSLEQGRGHNPLTIAAFTATADPFTQKLITESLGLRQPTKFLVNPYKANLDLGFRTIWTPRGRRQALQSFIRSQGQTSGLVYTRSRRASETMAAWGRELGYAVQAYHGGLNPLARKMIEEQWLGNQLQFVVCTCAFGMGIDKPDVAWVAHFEAPSLLSEYIQEVGRAGRNGHRAQILTLVSEPTGLLNNEDHQRQRFFLGQLRQQGKRIQGLMPQLPPQGEILGLRQKFPEVEFALSWLESSGQLSWDDPFHYRLEANSSRSPQLPPAVTAHQRLVQQTNLFYRTRGCRWQFILQASGFASTSAGFRCGHCDNCQRRKPSSNS